MSTKTRWGIIATGWVSNRFTEALKLVPDAQLAAVGSRSQASADSFADTHGIPRRHASYEALVADPDVDVVYVGTLHHLHRENTLMALEAGKHVLCEKPLAVNAREASEMVEMARKKGLFLEARSYEVVDFDRTEVVRKPFENGFQFEAEHAMTCIGAGRTESEVMSLDESLEIIRTMDALRAEWGLKYPFE